MEIIKDWLSGDKDYSTGLVILARYSKNRTLIHHLSRKQMPEKLEYELRKISGEPVRLEGVTSTDVLPENKEPLGSAPRINPDTLPVHLKQLWDETGEKYRLSRALHEQIKQMTQADQRAKGVEQLENYRKEIRANWEVIDSWALEQSNGPGKVVVDENRINADRKYLSDGKKSVMSLSGASRAKKLEGMQRRINELLSAGEKFDLANQKELEELGMIFNG